MTLAIGALASWALLRWLEPRVGRLLERRGRSLDPGGLRSVMFTIAAFAAFTSFYSFAGAPTLRLVPGLPHAFQLVVVTTATLFFVRRIGRRQETFAEETLARKIIANWKWNDMPPPRDLREAFLIHTIRSQSHEEARQRLLDLYKTAVRDSVESGVVSRGEVHRLEALRSQLRISDTDHERVMAELAMSEAAWRRPWRRRRRRKSSSSSRPTARRWRSISIARAAPPTRRSSGRCASGTGSRRTSTRWCSTSCCRAATGSRRTWARHRRSSSGPRRPPPA
jgi:hypothetical protein